MSAQEVPMNNSPFSSEEINHFEELLKEERKENKHKINEFKERLKELEDKLDDTNSSAAHHQGNIGSSEEEREKYYSLISKEEEKLEEIEEALLRIENGDYGICTSTGKPIKKERLKVKPYAKYSIEAVRAENTA